MAKSKKHAPPEEEAGFFLPGSKEAKSEGVRSYTFDLLFEMIADRIRAGEDPEEAAKAVFAMAKEFSDADDIIFDDDDGVSIESLEPIEDEKKDAD
jgi:hypothetical protein